MSEASVLDISLKLANRPRAGWFTAPGLDRALDKRVSRYSQSSNFASNYGCVGWMWVSALPKINRDVF